MITMHKTRTNFLFRGTIIELCICYNGSNKKRPDEQVFSITHCDGCQCSGLDKSLFELIV